MQKLVLEQPLGQTPIGVAIGDIVSAAQLKKLFENGYLLVKKSDFLTTSVAVDWPAALDQVDLPLGVRGAIGAHLRQAMIMNLPNKFLHEETRDVSGRRMRVLSMTLLEIPEEQPNG